MRRKSSKRASIKKPISSFLLFVLIFLSLGTVFLFSWLIKSAQQTSPIHIAFVGELTGSMSSVGNSSKEGIELAVSNINHEGGVLVGNSRRSVVLDVYDNESNVEKTKEVVEKAAKSNAVAIIGPNASEFAIVASTVAEKNHILLLSPWSTDPATTKNVNGTYKHYVYRAAFLDTVQAPALAHFALAALRATRASILYDQTADVLKKQATYFKQTFIGGDGEVLIDEGFSPPATPTTTSMASSHVIFLPAYYKDAARIIKLAKQEGVTVPILGSDAWGTNEMLTLCGEDCNGYYLTAHFASDSTSPEVELFDKSFKEAFGKTPDDIAALTYDSMSLVTLAVQRAASVNRDDIVNSMANTRNFKGVTGLIDYPSGNGDPNKSVFIVKIVDGKFTFVNEVYP